jgi:hypothetical protein
MAYTIYRSTDAGAPTLSGNTDSLIPLLDAILVNGYGSKPAAGWTKPFSGTNKAVYRNAATAIARSYFRVVDSTTNRFAKIRGYDTMTDVDTGTGAFPLTSDITGDGLSIPKSSTLDGVNRSWIAAADERTLVLFIQYSSTNWDMTYLGDGIPDVASNSNFSILAARQNETNDWNIALTIHCKNPAGYISAKGNYLKGLYGLVSAKLYRLFDGPLVESCFLAYSTGYGMSYIGGYLPMPNDGSIYLFQPPLAVYDEVAYWIRQGLYRFIYVPIHNPAAFSHGDTFNGVGALSGKSFEIIKPVLTYSGYSSPSTSGAIALVTSNPD